MKTLTLSPEQIGALKDLLHGFETLSDQAADRYYDRFIFEPDYPGQSPVEQYMKNNHAYKAFKELSDNLDKFENGEDDSVRPDFERVAEMFKLSPLHKKLVNSFGPERYEEIFKNIVNVMVNDSGLIGRAEKLDTLFVWEETEQGYDYWRSIRQEIEGRDILGDLS